MFLSIGFVLVPIERLNGAKISCLSSNTCAPAESVITTSHIQHSPDHRPACSLLSHSHTCRSYQTWPSSSEKQHHQLASQQFHPTSLQTITQYGREGWKGEAYLCPVGKILNRGPSWSVGNINGNTRLQRGRSRICCPCCMYILLADIIVPHSSSFH